MSLADSPDYLFRPEDKVLRMLFPSTEEPTYNSFDDFFDRELYELSNDEDNKGPSELDILFAHDSASTPSSSRIHKLKHEASPQPWRKGLWCLNQKADSELAIKKTRKTNRLAQYSTSPLNLAGNKHQAGENATKNSSSRSKPAKFVHQQPTHAPTARDETLSLDQLYAELPTRVKMEHSDGLSHDFKNFHLQMPDNGLYLSPKTVRSQKHELALRQANANVVTRNATIGYPPQSPTRYHYPFNHVPRIEDQQHSSANTLDPSFLEPPDSRPIYDGVSLYADAEHRDTPVWTTESLHSSDSSYYSHHSGYSNESYRQAYTNHAAQDWMSPSGISAHGMPSHEDAYRSGAPSSQQVGHLMTYQQQQQQQQHHHHHHNHPNGLGIHYGAVDEIGRAVSYGPPLVNKPTHHAPASPTQIEFSSYPPLPPAPPMSPILNDSSPFLTPRRRGKSISHSPSPPLSPTRLPSGYSLSQRSPSRVDHGRTRRKSLHKPGPIKGSGSATSNNPHRRTRSSSRPPRTPKTPKTPRTPTTGRFGQVDFVNFTPKDSAKLMSDVAPSGSSKTRARREQEARDKRKRLSEAAMQAVMRVGGDVTELEGAIFI